MNRILVITLGAVLAAGCAALGGASQPQAVANLEPTTGNAARGTATFRQDGDEVRVSVRLSGLKPNAEHGFHVHEKGDCSSGDGMSAGGHFNPMAKPHGPPHGDHHAGDMPNLKADENGNAIASFELRGVSVGSGASDVVGRGLVIHRDPDDYKTQPAGNSGPRTACGVIRGS